MNSEVLILYSRKGCCLCQTLEKKLSNICLRNLTPSIVLSIVDIDSKKVSPDIQIKYSGYIQKEKNNADKLNRLESVKIPKDFDYKKLKSISAEALEKLNKIKPETISQASRISGVSPNDISVLLVYMGR